MVKNDFNNSAGCSPELHNCGLDISGCFAQTSSEENVTAIAQYPPFSQRNQCLEKNMRTAEEHIKQKQQHITS